MIPASAHVPTKSDRLAKVTTHLDDEQCPDQRARLKVPDFDQPVLAARIHRVPAHREREHRARAAVKGMQELRRRVLRSPVRELPQLQHPNMSALAAASDSDAALPTLTVESPLPVTSCRLPSCVSS